MNHDPVTVYRAAYTVAALMYSGYALLLWRRARRARERLAKHGVKPT